MTAVPPRWSDTPTPSRDERRSIHVILADDHAVVREGLKALVNSQQDMHVVGEASNGDDAVRIAGELVPHVVVMDLSMPNVSGVEATRRLAAALPEVKVVALTVHEEPSYLAQLLKAGARGYVLKRSAAEHLVHAVRAVVAGGIYIDPSVASAVVHGYLQARSHLAGSADTILSDRERRVLVGIAQGYSNREIASHLELSVKTIETYKARFMEKLGIRTRVEIARYAAEHHLDDGPSPMCNEA